MDLFFSCFPSIFMLRYIRKAYGGIILEHKEKLVEIRNRARMNRREFAEYFGIPYRTVQDWELGNRQMPEYLFRLMEYKLRIEKIIE